MSGIQEVEEMIIAQINGRNKETEQFFGYFQEATLENMFEKIDEQIQKPLPRTFEELMVQARHLFLAAEALEIIFYSPILNGVNKHIAVIMSYKLLNAFYNSISCCDDYKEQSGNFGSFFQIFFDNNRNDLSPYITPLELEKMFNLVSRVESASEIEVRRSMISKIFNLIELMERERDFAIFAPRADEMNSVNQALREEFGQYSGHDFPLDHILLKYYGFGIYSLFSNLAKEIDFPKKSEFVDISKALIRYLLADSVSDYFITAQSFANFGQRYCTTEIAKSEIREHIRICMGNAALAFKHNLFSFPAELILNPDSSAAKTICTSFLIVRSNEAKQLIRMLNLYFPQDQSLEQYKTDLTIYQARAVALVRPPANQQPSIIAFASSALALREILYSSEAHL